MEESPSQYDEKTRQENNNIVLTPELLQQLQQQVVDPHIQSLRRNEQLAKLIANTQLTLTNSAYSPSGVQLQQALLNNSTVRLPQHQEKQPVFQPPRTMGIINPSFHASSSPVHMVDASTTIGLPGPSSLGVSTSSAPSSSSDSVRPIQTSVTKGNITITTSKDSQKKNQRVATPIVFIKKKGEGFISHWMYKGKQERKKKEKSKSTSTPTSSSELLPPPDIKGIAKNKRYSLSHTLEGISLERALGEHSKTDNKSNTDENNDDE